MKKILAVLFLSSLASQLQAQLSFDGSEKFSRKDTLRGTLSEMRACFDVNYYELDIKLDIEKRFISGKNKIEFTVLADCNQIQIDLFDNMKVDKIVWRGKELNFKRELNAVFIAFPNTLKRGSKEFIEFYYQGNPIIAKRAPWDGGFVFKKDKNNKDWVGVACQGTGASLWWPNKDHQSDEPDSMSIILTSTSDLMAVANGRLRSSVDLKDGYTKRHWFVANPINNYDVSINIADYYHWKEDYTSKLDQSVLSLDYYVLRGNEEKAKAQFKQVPPMLDAFEKRFGKYAFYEDGYKLVETPYLGMEHQSCVAYGNAYKNGYMGFDLSGSGEGLKFDYIIIHESAHEWWGNALTSYDIADMWIHEGFGQYAETIYLEELHGKESAIKYLNGIKKGVENKKPVIGPYGVNQEGSGDMYPKGALFLNTLRNTIQNDEIWFDILLSLQSKYSKKNIATEDVLMLMNEKSKMDLSALFKQYLYYPSLPELELQTIQDGRDLIVRYQWKTDVKNFSMPVVLNLPKENVRLNGTNAEQEIRIKKLKQEELKIDRSSFYFKLKD